ncbi:MAG TPA: hypothetical protein VGY53_11360, partial [Isosphaeraceae bacterium]|nr:hypothetical protein [Isosphaeraceae bacterium]
MNGSEHDYRSGQTERATTAQPVAWTGALPPEAALAGHRGLMQALDEMRRVLHSRLDALETLARDHARSFGGESEDRLKQQVARLERQCGDLRALADHMRQEQQTSLEQLEHDRSLLALAWDRLEQERIKCAQAPRDAPRKAAVNPFAPQVPVSSVTPSSDDP